MTRGVSYSASRAAALAAGMLAAVVAAAVHHHVTREWAAGIARVRDSERDLVRLAASMPGCEREDLEQLRARVERFRVELGAPDTWDGLVRCLGQAWIGSDAVRDDRIGYSAQAATLRMRSPAIADWPDIVATVRALEETPGVRVDGFEMRTSGGRERRSVDLVKIAVAIQTARPPAAPRTP